MPEHIHILVAGDGDAVRKFMQYSLAQSSRQIRMLLERKAQRGDVKAAEYLAFIEKSANGRSLGKVWKERFRSVALDREDAILVKLEYMHNNPVRRGLVDHPQDWECSSWRNYSGGSSSMAVDLPSCCGN